MSTPAETASSVAPAVEQVVSTPAAEGVNGEENYEAQAEGLTLRALVSSKEAGVIIGRGGATIATLRSESNVKAGVSKVVPGFPDRILSVGGTVEGVAKAYTLVASTILSSPPSSLSQDLTPTPTATTTTVRLLISHLLIGSVIGKGGAKIRSIQDNSGARMVASKEMLPQSTERIVEVSGSAESIGSAISEISRCLIEDWDRSQGTVLYMPGAEGMNPGGGGYGQQGQGYQGRRPQGMGMGGQVQQQQSDRFPRRASAQVDERAFGMGAANQRNGPAAVGGLNDARRASAPAGGIPMTSPSDPNYREQNISIPSDMVGCIIGRGGTKINEIRRLSGSKISIAKTAHDDTGERMFVISGLPENNEKALFLLYNQLESEKERRVQSVAEEDAAQEA